MPKDFRLTSLLKKVKNINLYEFSGRTGQSIGIATMCIGGGQGIALAVDSQFNKVCID